LSLLDATELHLEESSSIDMIDKFPLHRYLIRIMLKALTLRIPQSSVGVVAPGERVLIAHTATSDEFHIEMPEIVSLEGHWWAERAQVRSAGGVDRNQGKPGNTEESP
jgi:hypothetical protein